MMEIQCDKCKQTFEDGHCERCGRTIAEIIEEAEIEIEAEPKQSSAQKGVFNNGNTMTALGILFAVLVVIMYIFFYR